MSFFVYSSKVLGLPFFFLLEFSIWNLTITFPDLGLNGNLVSGPFKFIFEYPWSKGYGHPNSLQSTDRTKWIITHDCKCNIIIFS